MPRRDPTGRPRAPAPPRADNRPDAPTRAVPFLRSVRLRLLLIALIPLVVVLPLLLAVAGAGWLQRFDELTAAKVASDLTVADQQLRGLMQDAAAGLESLARSAALRDAAEDPEALAALLEAERVRLSLDILHWIAPDGAAIGAPPSEHAAGLAAAPVVAEALAGRRGAAIEIFSAARLRGLSPALAARARIALTPTEAAAPSDRRIEDRGMVALAAAPAHLGPRAGALAGGVLLNRNLAFIDRINELVYSDAGLIAGSVGTATLFLEDVRISTNVRLFEGERALGTRVSAAVRDAVLQDGRTWLDRAFVVNDWYNSGYLPLEDGRGNRIGMLYVGFLDAPYAAARRNSAAGAAGVFALALLLGGPVLLWWARGIFKPLERVSQVIARVEAGELSARTGLGAGAGTSPASEPAAGDEIARAAAHIDHLLDVVEEREARLRGWNERLEARVAERTADLREANRRLEAATRQLIVSEKLAAIGEITAGVAHEINNPLAVMQGNLEVILDDLGDRAAPLSFEFELIQQQIQRVHELVSKLLQFSRPEEYAAAPEGHDPNAAAAEALTLVEHLLKGGGIAVETDLRATRQVAMNRAELQQVLVNLLVNAIQAMGEGGRLRLRCEDAPGTVGAASRPPSHTPDLGAVSTPWPREAEDPNGRGQEIPTGARPTEPEGEPCVAFCVEDDGPGMAPEVTARIFDPFFTTRHGEGTGLGLSISRKLAERAGGRISVESAPGRGARLRVTIPAARPHRA